VRHRVTPGSERSLLNCVLLQPEDYFHLVTGHVQFLVSHFYKQLMALLAIYMRKGMSDTEIKDSKIKQ